jgi:Domain of Unknown Function (DUF1080)
MRLSSTPVPTLSRREALVTLAAGGVTASCIGTAKPSPQLTVKDSWTPLFNGLNLEGWTASRGEGAGLPAEQIFSAKDGAICTYVGAPDGSEQSIATLRTNASYGKYVLQLEFKWGHNRFGQRSAQLRDAGIIFHSFGDPNVVWPKGIEYQIGESPIGGEWVTGDIWLIGQDVRAESSLKDGKFLDASGGGVRTPIGGKRFTRLETTIDAADHQRWNLVELTVHGDREAEYRLNGVVVNRVFNMQYNHDGWRPLASGPIMLQAEWAEVSYRNIRIKELR